MTLFCLSIGCENKVEEKSVIRLVVCSSDLLLYQCVAFSLVANSLVQAQMSSTVITLKNEIIIPVQFIDTIQLAYKNCSTEQLVCIIIK